ncbi:hypothetical protein NXS19_004233 [Fusarium pseudograminearum]|nr:hypothetical protein NXS19_004233 [Fusarium pseudograminearum]
MYSIYYTFCNFCVLSTFSSFLGFARAASLLEDGNNFTNNLVSDLAPLLALVSERVTTQFISQSTGWADCIALAIAPVGVITIIVSAIRITGPRWLKAVVGRARENVAAAELEVMSSTSSEACNKQKRNTLKRVQIMDIKNARNRDKTNDSNHQETGTAPLDEHRSSLISPNCDDTIIITHNKAHLAPNMALNCSADGERWQMWAYAAVGIIIQSGILIFFWLLD